jgi:hypothetical protein
MPHTLDLESAAWPPSSIIGGCSLATSPGDQPAEARDHLTRRKSAVRERSGSSPPPLSSEWAPVLFFAELALRFPPVQAGQSRWSAVLGHAPSGQLPQHLGNRPQLSTGDGK